MTFECSRCHDHKYDPISQKEFYQFFAFFQNIDESGQSVYFGDIMPVPTLLLSTPDQETKLKDLNARIQAGEGRLKQLTEASCPPLPTGSPRGGQASGSLRGRGSVLLRRNGFQCLSKLGGNASGAALRGSPICRGTFRKGAAPEWRKRRFHAGDWSLFEGRPVFDGLVGSPGHACAPPDGDSS